jgi:Ni,Fe-hydrogenase III small subunit
VKLDRSSVSTTESTVAHKLGEMRAMFGRSLHIRTIDTGSCAVCESEIRLLLAPHFDLHRLGLFFTPAPRHADLLMVTGPAVRAMDVALKKTYMAMPEPKVVIAVGACPLGGVYGEDEVVHGNLDQVLPVDVYVPGCPPSPLALLQGLLVAVGRLREKVSAITFCDGSQRSFRFVGDDRSKPLTSPETVGEGEGRVP